MKEDLFLVLYNHFGSPKLKAYEDIDISFNDLIRRRSKINSDTVEEYCADCIALLERLTEADCEKACQLLDTVLILSGPNEDIQKLLYFYYKELESNEIARYPLEFDPCAIKGKVSSQIPVIGDPTIKEFNELQNYPFVSSAISSSWNASHKWKNPQFWLKLAAYRYFPVEIGSSYLEADWSQDFIQLKAYLDDYVFSSTPSKIAYIAQHNWVHQLPVLKEDFEIPELCDFFLADSLTDAMVHFWFGMAGTQTPLHYDKYNNFFCQVVGTKKVILVNPSHRHLFSDGSNTCPVHGDQLDTLLTTVPHHTVIVDAGQTLFIPKGWWHQVESLSFSISLSFWF